MHQHDTAMQPATIRRGELLQGAARTPTARTARRAARRNRRHTA